MIWWASSVCDVAQSVRTESNESERNKAGSPVIHIVPERHIIWHQTWNTFLTCPSLCLIYPFTHTHRRAKPHSVLCVVLQSLGVKLTTEIGLKYMTWTSLFEKNILNGRSKTFGSESSLFLTVTVLLCLGGQADQNWEKGEMRKWAPYRASH